MSYIKNQELNYRNKNPIDVLCDSCGHDIKMTYKSAEKNRKKNGKHVCMSCCGHKPRPQQESGFWTSERRRNHSESIKKSAAYSAAISTRDSSKENNGMYGRKHNASTIKKMRASRIGKIGVNATAWKGGKTSVNCRVKKIIHTRYNWYFRVYQRDGFKCTRCKSNKKIDAHHIEPVSLIIKRLVCGKNFSNDDEKVLYLTAHPDIIDIDLKNGLTLCRACHKKEHGTWGSHVAKK